jgi:RNA polymerase sigma-70 factor (ECF subfamily)
MIARSSPSAADNPLSNKMNQDEHLTASRRESLHDAALVGRFNAGDAGAFTEIVSRYRAKLFAIAFSRLKNHTDAEEIAQDTLIRAYHGLAQFRGESSLSTWLHRITVNLASNRYWHFFRRRRHLTQSLDQSLGDGNSATFADVISSDAPGPAREAMTAEFSVLVATCMDRLAPDSREILSLRNNLNNSYEEIAAALGIKVGTVKSRIARSRGRLRELIAETCPEFSPSDVPAAWLSLRRAPDEAPVLSAWF